MGKAPEICINCKGTGDGPGSPCGFCENGKPLDTQEDWDATWGRLFPTPKVNPCKHEGVWVRTFSYNSRMCVDCGTILEDEVDE